jgi:hypothetical protein
MPRARRRPFPCALAAPGRAGPGARPRGARRPPGVAVQGPGRPPQRGERRSRGAGGASAAGRPPCSAATLHTALSPCRHSLAPLPVASPHPSSLCRRKQSSWWRCGRLGRRRRPPSSATPPPSTSSAAWRSSWRPSGRRWGRAPGRRWGSVVSSRQLVAVFGHVAAGCSVPRRTAPVGVPALPRAPSHCHPPPPPSPSFAAARKARGGAAGGDGRRGEPDRRRGPARRPERAAGGDQGGGGEVGGAFLRVVAVCGPARIC